MLLTASQHIVTQPRHWELSALSAQCQAVALQRMKDAFVTLGSSPKAGNLMKAMAAERDPAFTALPSACAQHAVGRAAADYWNFVKAVVAWKKTPTKFKRKPRMPVYRRKYGQVFITNVQFRVKEGFIVFLPQLGLPPVPFPSNVPALAQLMGITLTPRRSGMMLSLSYETKPCTPKQRRAREKAWQKQNQSHQSTNSAGKRLIVDLNIKGIAVLNDTAAGKLAASVVSLKPLVARIGLGSNVVATYQSRDFKHDARRSAAHRDKLNRYTLHYLHCVANELVAMAKASGAKYILVGKNKGWKQGANMGRRSNRRFCSLPLAKLLTLLGYKCRLAGIWLQLTEESYTSKVDHLALEPMQHQATYLGRRVHRGLFRSSTGRTFHADINGCLGIGRKISGDRWIRHKVRPLARKGARLAPLGTVLPRGLLAMPRRGVRPRHSVSEPVMASTS